MILFTGKYIFKKCPINPGETIVHCKLKYAWLWLSFQACVVICTKTTFFFRCLHPFKE